MPALNVLHIIKSLGRGGAETLLAETIRITDRGRINTHVIYFLPWKNQMVASMQQSGAVVTCFEASNNLLILLQVFRLKRYCREHKIDVVHCHLPWAGFAGRLLFLLARIPVVYTEHNLQERYHFFTRILNRMTFN
ncbi:MAG: glycosyltransferase family 1 protein, partial [Cyclobacteriaceae bacterium]